MDIIDTKTEEEILRSMIAEIAKANNEINCARADIKKAQTRMNFMIVLANKLLDRQENKI